MKMIKKSGLGFLITACLLLVNLPVQAGMVSTAQFIEGSATNTLSTQSFTQQRVWIKQQLQKHGVSAVDADLRVRNLTDNQVSKIHQKMDELPAGASAGGLLLTLFIVLLITDIAGYTDIFPFVRPAN